MGRGQTHSMPLMPGCPNAKFIAFQMDIILLSALWGTFLSPLPFSPGRVSPERACPT